jgi:hypothetical protein
VTLDEAKPLENKWQHRLKWISKHCAVHEIYEVRSQGGIVGENIRRCSSEMF